MDSTKKLNVFYRICPYPATKSPIFDDDKLTLVTFCLKSFKKAFKNVDYKITFILDSCPPVYSIEIDNMMEGKENIIEGEKMGDRGSLLKQVELASKLENDDKVYFAEDDYIYLPGAGAKLVEALDEYAFVTLYDHPDYYTETQYLKDKVISISANHHWVSRMSTCHTFGTKAIYLKENGDVFNENAPNDFKSWSKITKTEILVSPIPSLATHMVTWLLAPTINWGYEMAK